MSRYTKSSGRLVDTWYYEYKGIEGKDCEEGDVKEIKVPIEVRIGREFKNSTAPPKEVKEVWFTISCENPSFTLLGPDIEALRADMWSKLDKNFATKWERWYLIEIDHRSPYEGLGTGLCFSYEDIEKGVAFDGSLLMREFRHGYVVKPWPGEFVTRDNRILACIPATKSNKKALEEFTSRIDKLREHLAELVRPANILKTLSTLSSILPALEPPKEQE